MAPCQGLGGLVDPAHSLLTRMCSSVTTAWRRCWRRVGGTPGSPVPATPSILLCVTSHQTTSRQRCLHVSRHSGHKGERASAICSHHSWHGRSLCIALVPSSFVVASSRVAQTVVLCLQDCNFDGTHSPLALVVNRGRKKKNYYVY